MKVLIGCECSGIIRNAFNSLGHEAYSCDVKPSEDNSKYHLQCDVFEAIEQISPDIGIFHPPCTYIAVSGAKWFDSEEYPERRNDQKQAIDFAYKLWKCDIKHICIENPIGVLSTATGVYSLLGKPTQIIQPWQFGEEYQKSTCLWLKNLPTLRYTNVVNKGEFITTSGGNRIPAWYSKAKTSDLDATRTIRSRTPIGIADAMAVQWSDFVCNLNPMLEMFLS